MPGVIPTQIDRTFATDGSVLTMVGYGCDNGNPANSGQKEFANVTTQTFPTGLLGQGTTVSSNLGHHDVEFFSNSVTGCAGDSGGPWFHRTSSNTYGVVGVTSQGLILDATDLYTFGARVGNVQQWLDSPAENFFADGEEGTFINPGSTFCLEAVTGQGTIFNPQGSVIANYCDGRNQPFDNQFWYLQRINTSWFQLLQSVNGQCLGLSNGAPHLAACNPAPTSSSDQAWHFALDHSANGHDYYRLMNGSTGSCLSTSVVPGRPGPLGAPVAGAVAHRQGCGSPSLGEDYIFSR